MATSKQPEIRRGGRNANKNGPQPKANGRQRRFHNPDAARYAQLKSTIREKREELAKRGLVDIDLNPIDVLQRAIDDTAGDYAILRSIIDEFESPEQAIRELPLIVEYSAALRHEMTKYATLALNYNIQERSTKLAEVEMLLLGHFMTLALDELRKRGLIGEVSPEAAKMLPLIIAEEVETVQSDPSGTNLDYRK